MFTECTFIAVGNSVLEQATRDLKFGKVDVGA
jgi:hypothetical protein